MGGEVLIAGGGIGGLAAALCLERAGIACTVFESAPEARELGVGINLLPHAVRILTELGLDADLKATGIPTAELAYYSKFGQPIWSEPRGISAGYAWPQYSVHRGRLHALLWRTAMQRLGAPRVRTGHRLVRFESDGNDVRAWFAREKGGEPFSCIAACALIGADGIHSVVRRTLYPDEGEPLFSGRLLWRATSLGRPFLGGRTMIMAGHANQKFVAYPICPLAESRGEALINWVAELYVGGGKPPIRRDWNRKAEKAVFAPAFQTWRFPWLDVPALIESAEEVFEFPMTDRDPVPRWSFGRVTLLGDAAHPMYPIGSNGASQAILDADALALALARHANVEEALRIYERERLEPTAEIVRSNRRQGPEIVMQIVEERAPNGFDRLEDVIGQQELEEIAQRYKRIAGFDRQTLEVP
jgi:2-polyprenyl-6-methoxyphenol hydroxylase-like FAD-dependent oxidoreductase